jgi:hypothetical protein
MLLSHVRGAQSYEDVRTHLGVLYPTFKECCGAKGMLAEDGEWDQCLTEASAIALPRQLRNLFANILIFNSPTDALQLWQKHKPSLLEDYLREGRRTDPDLQLTDAMENRGLLEIQVRVPYGPTQSFSSTLYSFSGLVLLSHLPIMQPPHLMRSVWLQVFMANTGMRRTLKDFHLPEPVPEEIQLPGVEPTMVAAERYDFTTQQRNQAADNVRGLNPEQRQLYDAVLEAVDNPDTSDRVCSLPFTTPFTPQAPTIHLTFLGGLALTTTSLLQGNFFFVDGVGGTGKTFTYNALLHAVRAKEGKPVALAAATSGVAAVLLDGGRTAHSLFALPIPISKADQGRWGPITHFHFCLSCCCPLQQRVA